MADILFVRGGRRRFSENCARAHNLEGTLSLTTNHDLHNPGAPARGGGRGATAPLWNLQGGIFPLETEWTIFFTHFTRIIFVLLHLRN